MSNIYRTNREILIEYAEESNQYRELKNRLRKDAKRYRTLQETTKNEDYKLAYSIVADYLEEISKEK